MPRPYDEHRRQSRRKKQFSGYETRWDFIPDKHQIIHGALLDLGRPLNHKQVYRIARTIATMYDEDI